MGGSNMGSGDGGMLEARVMSGEVWRSGYIRTDFMSSRSLLSARMLMERQVSQAKLMSLQ